MSEPTILKSRIEKSVPSGTILENAADAQHLERRFLEHFGLNEQPFGVTPDPRFLYLGPKHREALTALTYGTELNRGFLTLIAKPGMGKTSLLFQYLENLRNKARTVFLCQSIGDARELMSYLLADLGVESASRELPDMYSMLNQILMEEVRVGRRVVLVIDEAQNLDEKVLESVRLLSNFETPWMKLIQIVLAGQPQLGEKLGRPSMSQLRQRVSFSIRIEPFTRDEVDDYINHRLWVAGHNSPALFSVGARALIAEHSEGIPRTINNTCFCAMSLAWATQLKNIDRELIRDILRDSDAEWSDGKSVPRPKPSGETRQVIAVTAAPPIPAFVLNENPSHSWPKKVVLAGILLVVLALSGVYFNVGPRIVMLLHEMQDALKGFAGSPAAQTLVVPDLPAAAKTFSCSVHSDVPTDDNGSAVKRDSGTRRRSTYCYDEGNVATVMLLAGGLNAR